ncbi:MAG: hypothetical protein ACFFD6_02970, partial [Candidatus Thorarchaeota archaeon]
ALVSVRHPEDFSEIAKQQLLKSSLPFFRSVSIHHVDAIASTAERRSNLPFPLNFEIGPQLQPALKGLGFIEEQTVYHYTIEMSESESKVSDEALWRESQDYIAIRDLFWKQSNATGLDSSLVTLGLEMAMARGKLLTYSNDGRISMALGIEPLADSVVVWPLMADLSAVDLSGAAEAVYDVIRPLGKVRLQIPIVALGQQDLISALCNLCSSGVSFRENILMRKNL